MEHIFKKIKNAKKRQLFRTKKLFSYGERITEPELIKIENEIGKIPEDIRTTLLELGEGIINDLRIHGKDGIYPFDDDCGLAEGYVAFASDEMGNYYSYNPNSNHSHKIYYVCHDPTGYCLVANNIKEFLTEFIDRGYNITDHVAELDLIEINT